MTEPENLRAVARLVPLQSTLCVAGSSDMHSIQDMRGKRFPAGFRRHAISENA